MAIKAALLDAPASSGKGVYLRIDELDDASALTACHLSQVAECDLASGKYCWIATDNPNNPYGGAFWPLAWLKKLEPETRAQLEHF